MIATAITGKGITNNPMIMYDLNSKTFKSLDTKFTNFPMFASLIQKLDSEDTFSYKAFIKRTLKLEKK